MYRAINEWVIVKRDLQDKKTESGIILNAPDDLQVLELEVTATTDVTKDLQGKIIVVQRHKVMQLNQSSNEKYGSVKLEDILAVKE